MHPLERARAARGWSRACLARRICELSAQDPAAATLGTGRDGIWRFEHGRRPDRLTQSLIAAALGIPPEAVGERSWPEWLTADPLQLPAPCPWDPPGAIRALQELLECENMDRRNFIRITGTTLTGSLLAWLTADPAAAGQIAGGRRISEPAVARVEERVRQLRLADDADGGGQLVTEASASLRLVAGLLRDRSYTDAHGARLHAAAADLTRMTAWGIFDVEDVCADTVFDSALRAAQAASDPALGAHVLAFWSIAASNTGRAGDAEAMVSAALTAVRGRTTPRVEAMLYSRRARARARLGDSRCWHDVGRASDCLDAVSPGQDDPEWAYWFNRAELLGVTASTHLDCGQPARAEHAFADAAALFPRERIRTQALFLTRQADAQLRQNDLERACATASRALDLTAEISSHRSIGPLRDLSAKMSPHDAFSVVHDFRERARDLLSAALA
jgi:hypothetical protein